MNALWRTINLINKAIDATLAAGMLAIAGILFLQVIQRYGFRAALPWPEEMAGFLLVYVSLLGAYRAIGSGNHMAFEVIPPDTTKPPLVLLRILAQLLIVVFLLVLVYGGIELVFLAGSQPSTALRLPMSIPYLITPVSAALMTIASLLQVAELASRLRRPGGTASAMPGDDRP